MAQRMALLSLPLEINAAVFNVHSIATIAKEKCVLQTGGHRYQDFLLCRR